MLLAAAAPEEHAVDGGSRGAGQERELAERRKRHARLAPVWTGERERRRQRVVHGPLVVPRFPDAVTARVRGSIRDQRMDVVTLEAVATLEERELDDESDADDHAAEALHELDGRARCTARREDVVEDHDTAAARNRVPVGLKRVGAVLELVGGLDRLARQLPGLARSDEPRVELVRERAAEDESARLGAEHVVRLLRARPL